MTSRRSASNLEVVADVSLSFSEDAHSGLLEFLLTFVQEEDHIILVDFRMIVQWKVCWFCELVDLGFASGSSSSEMLLRNY